MDIVCAAFSVNFIGDSADAGSHFGILVCDVLTMYHCSGGGFQVSGDTMNKAVALQDSLFQACGDGMSFTQVHIGLEFQIEIGFKESVDFADVDIMGVYPL